MGGQRMMGGPHAGAGKMGAQGSGTPSTTCPGAMPPMAGAMMDRMDMMEKRMNMMQVMMDQMLQNQKQSLEE